MKSINEIIGVIKNLEQNKIPAFIVHFESREKLDFETIKYAV